MIFEDVRSRIEIRRDRVADAARDLFSRNGFHATGIAQIAETSGIKVQQIYRDFANKEAIVAAIVATDVGKLFAEVSGISSRAGYGRTELREWVRSMLLSVMAKEKPQLFLEIFAEASRNPRIAAILAEIDSQARAALLDAFTAFAPDAEPGRLSVVVDLFLTFIGGVSHRIVADATLDMDRLAEMMCGLIVDQIPA